MSEIMANGQLPSRNTPNLGFFNQGLNSDVMTLLPTGNVGIGTTSPGAKLDVNGTIKLGGTSSNKYIFGGATGTGDVNGRIDIYSNTGATDGAYITLYGPNYSGREGGAEITSYGTTAGWIKFNNYNGTTWNELMRITNTGNVGIGTTAPTAPLHISSAGGASSELFRLTKTGTSAASYRFDVSATVVGDNSDLKIVPENSATGLVLFSRDSGGVLQAGVVIQGTGNVGIGTMSPGAKLHVSGISLAGSGIRIDASGTAPTTAGTAFPIVGSPTIFLPIIINGVRYRIPAYAL